MWDSHPGWLLSHSLQAGVLVLVVLLVQWVFRRRLTNRWRFALWWIVLARLVLPFGPASALSLFNVLRPAVQFATPPPPSTVSATDRDPQPTAWTEANSPDSLALPPPATTLPVATHPPRPAPVRPLSDWLVPGLTMVWLAGVLTLLAVVVVQFVRFQRRVARDSRPADPALRALLDECRGDFGIARPVALLETNAVQSPALFGLWRLRLLLPPGLAAQFNRAELRYIFLHELAHVRRGDLSLNWLVTGLQVLHWFNPLLWLGFARLRSDRELACDELALLRSGDQSGDAYGETVVKLLENLNRPAVIPGLVGILEDRQQMRRRILMIARFRPPGRWSALAALLVAALAFAALTDAQTPPTTAPINTANHELDANLYPAKSAISPTPVAPEEDVWGKVLLPDGSAATNPQVALQVEGKILRLSKDALWVSDGPRLPAITTWRNGQFRLPARSGAQSVVARSAEGYAQVPVAEVRQTHQITLQPWGRIEGILHVGHALGTNQIMQFRPFEEWGASMSITNLLNPPIYEPSMSQTTTDDHGRFAFNRVPPGRQVLDRLIDQRAGGRTWSSENLPAIVEVPPGGTLVTNLGGHGRTVIGRLSFSPGMAPAITNGILGLENPRAKIMRQMRQMKTAEERAQFSQTDEYQKMMMNWVNIVAVLQPDGSFRADEVPPGNYELDMPMLGSITNFTRVDVDKYLSQPNVLVPPAKDNQDDSPVDLGAVEMTKTDYANSAATSTNPPQEESSPYKPDFMRENYMVMPKMAVSSPLDANLNPPKPAISPAVSTPEGDLEGVVLSPDGNSGTIAQVAIQIKGTSLGDPYQGWNTPNTLNNSIYTSPNGKFRLTVPSGAESVVAQNDEGYAQISLEQARQAHQILLQKWGRVEGVLHLGHALGIHQAIYMKPLEGIWARLGIPGILRPPEYDSTDLTTTTDDQGRFLFLFVPPGKQILSLSVYVNGGSTPMQMSRQLAKVEVRPGETVVTNVGGTGRTVIGRLSFGTGTAPAFTNCILHLGSPHFKLLNKLRQMQTPKEREEFCQSDEFQQMMTNFVGITAVLRPDGSFLAEEAPPGRYELGLTDLANGNSSNDNGIYQSSGEFIVPPAKDNQDDSPVDVGAVAMTKLDRTRVPSSNAPPATVAPPANPQSP